MVSSMYDIEFIVGIITLICKGFIKISLGIIAVNVPVIVHIKHQYISKKMPACQEAERGKRDFLGMASPCCQKLSRKGPQIRSKPLFYRSIRYSQLEFSAIHKLSLDKSSWICYSVIVIVIVIVIGNDNIQRRN